jgi:hypothetical protein
MKTNKSLRDVLAIALLTLSAAVAWAANEVYIEQSGDDSTITINQDGSNNKIGQELTPAFIGGGSNIVTIDQIGMNNTLDLVVNGAGTSVVVSAIGSNNDQTIHCGSTMSASCSQSVIRSEITGSNNTTIQNLNQGANHESKISITGDSNSVTHTSTSNGTTSAQITVVGDSNTIGVTQSGTTNNTVKVNSIANNTTIAITQSKP